MSSPRDLPKPSQRRGWNGPFKSITARTVLAAASGTVATSLIASGAIIALNGSFAASLQCILAIFGAAFVSVPLVTWALRGLLAPIDELQKALEYYREHGVQAELPEQADRGDLVSLVEGLLSRVQSELNVTRTAADTDPLTGLLNRRGFDRHLVAGDVGSIIFVDLDDFKMVNDTLGHDAGDLVLSATADLLRKSLREGELVARFGGEEFVVFLPHIGLNTAMLVAERIRKTAEQTLGSSMGRITISAGVAEQGLEESFAAALIRADRAAYRAKNDGRNCVRVDMGCSLGEITPLPPATAAE